MRSDPSAADHDAKTEAVKPSTISALCLRGLQDARGTTAIGKASADHRSHVTASRAGRDMLQIASMTGSCVDPELIGHGEAQRVAPRRWPRPSQAAR